MWVSTVRRYLLAFVPITPPSETFREESKKFAQGEIHQHLGQVILRLEQRQKCGKTKQPQDPKKTTRDEIRPFGKCREYLGDKNLERHTRSDQNYCVFLPHASIPRSVSVLSSQVARKKAISQKETGLRTSTLALYPTNHPPHLWNPIYLYSYIKS